MPLLAWISVEMMAFTLHAGAYMLSCMALTSVGMMQV